MEGAPGKKRDQVVPRAAPAVRGITARQALQRLRALGNEDDARLAQTYFKTGKGEYGEGDRFLGIRAPALHALVRDMKKEGATQAIVLPLLNSQWNEARAAALLLLVRFYREGNEDTRAGIFDLYLSHTHRVNGWNLVDLSAEHIVGAWLADKPALRKRVLTKLARSPSLWERRIAMLATFHSIKRGDAAETLRIAEILIHDREDLIHKAVGWMLREVGKRIGEEYEEPFLKRFQNTMPRTMLRYAIERFPEAKRKRYLAGDM